jgi:ribosome biogenesis SPOUT family RNA methylase Rps3
MLAGRVLCLEQVLLRVIAHLGFDEVKKRVVGSNQLALDTAVRAAFGSGMQADDINACRSLERRVKSLATEAGGMLTTQDYRFCDEGSEQ